jgi:hypothetical protein
LTTETDPPLSSLFGRHRQSPGVSGHNKPACDGPASQPAILSKSAFFFQTSPHQALFTARKRPLTTSVKVPLDTNGNARMLVDLLLVQPFRFTQVPNYEPLGGEGSRTPVSYCYVQRRPRMLYQSHCRGKHVSMNKRGRTRMLLVLLLPWQAFENIRNRSIGPLVSVIRTVGSAGSRR